MCGIAGFITQSNSDSKRINDIVTKMSDTLRHRGPDDKGIWVNGEHGIALGHRRLSIIDTSVAGHQPMLSHCGRYVIILNGEIYNFKTLRHELESKGFKFKGHSDTEIMLAAISSYGVDSAIKKFNGMFAFALWDRKKHILSLARDRTGQKPMYYGFSNNTFLFASELKAMRVYPGFKNSINRDALALYMRFNCIPAPHSIYENIYKLPPSSILKFNYADLASKKYSVDKYWSLSNIASNGIEHILDQPSDQLQDTVEQALSKSVNMRMESDVPLGVFLSGGIDSSLITALMQKNSSTPIKTFTIGFKDQAYNEAEHAKLIAKHLGTDHTEFCVTPEEAISIVPRLADIYDEPFADSSQIPTFLVSQLTRDKVTVSLSGDGGDEVFSGYNRHYWVKNIWSKIGWLNPGIRGVIAKALLLGSPRSWENIFSKFDNSLPKGSRHQTPGDKMHKLAGVLSAKSAYDMYIGLRTHWDDPQSMVYKSNEPKTIVTDTDSRIFPHDIIQEMMYKDAVTYLPDDILTKVDRASMAVSLESRAPFLDHELIELAWRLPMNMKLKGSSTKFVLRKILDKYIPPTLIERPKMGFGLPIGQWLRGPLNDWAESLLVESDIKREGFFDSKPIMQKWREHISGKMNWQYLLWDVLMFQSWYKRWQ